MSRNLLNATFDAATELKDAGAVAATAAAQVGGVARIVNVGNGLLQATMIVDFDAIKTTVGDESYELRLQGSTSPTFATGVYNLAVTKVGGATATGETVASTIGRKAVPFVNTNDGSTPLPYLRLYTVVAGTAPTANFRAFITKNPTH